MIGKTLGHDQITQKLSKNGMGEAFHAKGQKKIGDAVIHRLLSSVEPSIRYKTRISVLGESPDSPLDPPASRGD